jgi:putative FmdB family regulatory protein
MKILYSFQCQGCKETFDELTEYKKVSKCPSCGSDADKLISTPRVSLEGYSGAFPSAAMAWEKKHKYQPSQDE